MNAGPASVQSRKYVSIIFVVLKTQPLFLCYILSRKLGCIARMHFEVASKLHTLHFISLKQSPLCMPSAMLFKDVFRSCLKGAYIAF